MPDNGPCDHANQHKALVESSHVIMGGHQNHPPGILKLKTVARLLATRLKRSTDDKGERENLKLPSEDVAAKIGSKEEIRQLQHDLVEEQQRKCLTPWPLCSRESGRVEKGRHFDRSSQHNIVEPDPAVQSVPDGILEKEVSENAAYNHDSFRRCSTQQNGIVTDFASDDAGLDDHRFTLSRTYSEPAEREGSTASEWSTIYYRDSYERKASQNQENKMQTSFDMPEMGEEFTFSSIERLLNRITPKSELPEMEEEVPFSSIERFLDLTTPKSELPDSKHTSFITDLGGASIYSREVDDDKGQQSNSPNSKNVYPRNSPVNPGIENREINKRFAMNSISGEGNLSLTQTTNEMFGLEEDCSFQAALDQATIDPDDQDLAKRRTFWDDVRKRLDTEDDDLELVMAAPAEPQISPLFAERRPLRHPVQTELLQRHEELQETKCWLRARKSVLQAVKLEAEGQSVE